MLRVISYMRRFAHKCRHNASPALAITQEEIDASLRAIVIDSQQCFFAALKNELVAGVSISSKPMARLCPFLDDYGVIRVGGRLRHSLLPYEQKHPILLAKRSHLAILIFRWYHEYSCHAGPRVMLTLATRQFWILSARAVVHKVISRCTTCVRYAAVNPQPRMADLPSARVTECQVFRRVGIDYAGPLQMREIRLRKSRTYKVYLAIFVCFTVKAVHLEVVTELSTEAFLAAFDRFVARRGLPAQVFSDCGSNFIGADKQLRDLINSATSQIKIAAATPMCEWHFNAPSAAHMGGLWESAVRSAKRLLIRVMGAHMFTYEEFTTVICRIESVLNSRPLVPSSTDPQDLDCLTPGHFLIGQPLLAVPPRTELDAPRSLVDRWKLLDHCHQAFWHRWSSEYLSTLQQRAKWLTDQPNVRVGAMVIIKDNSCPPLMWRLGRITALMPGPDKIVRVVRVQTAQGTFVRPVVKLVVLPTDPDDSIHP
ncbi:uncharacterized protein LOC126909604 [Daktulosphaira vitifoliae]|nr:uncharacterized protein LOC126909604 [Daktulosphaira vitifoliae]